MAKRKSQTQIEAVVEFAGSFDRLGRPKELPDYRWPRKWGPEPARHRTWRRLEQLVARFRLYRAAGLDTADTDADKAAMARVLRQLQRQALAAMKRWVG